MWATLQASPTADCRRPEFSLPPHRRANSLVSPRPWLLARHVPRSTSVLIPADIFDLSHRATGGHRATTPRRAGAPAPGAVGHRPLGCRPVESL
jgi:hypothetical protein